MANEYGLSEEVAALLNRGQKAYEDGLERANPPPEDGQYTVQLRGLACRQFASKKKDAKQAEYTVVRLNFEVLGNGPFGNYRFGHDFFDSAFDELSTFASASAGKPVQRLLEAYAVLGSDCNTGKSPEDSVKGVFDISIERTESSDKLRKFVHIRALRRVRPEG
jgi:hypothetical protein